MSELSDDNEGEAVLDGLRELPGGSELLELAQQRADVELVGGAVRDLLLGRRPRELDVIVEAGAPGFAQELADFLDGRLSALGVRSEVETHERFGTAVVRFDGGRIDVAARRAESYAAPGALPDVRAGTPEQDLLRRDFTVNAIAVALGGERRGRAARGAARARGPAGGAPARAARRQLSRRPHAHAAHGALRGAAGLRARRAHGAPGRAGDRRRRAGHGFAGAHRRRAAPDARRARCRGGAGGDAALWARCRRCTRRSSWTRRSPARRLPRCRRRRKRMAGRAAAGFAAAAGARPMTRPTTRRACACCSTATSSRRPSASARCTARSWRRAWPSDCAHAQTPSQVYEVAHDAALEAVALAAGAGAGARRDAGRRRGAALAVAAAHGQPGRSTATTCCDAACRPGRRSAGACAAR